MYSIITGAVHVPAYTVSKIIGCLGDVIRDTWIGHLTTENQVLPYFEREAATIIFFV